MARWCLWRNCRKQNFILLCLASILLLLTYTRNMKHPNFSHSQQISINTTGYFSKADTWHIGHSSTDDVIDCDRLVTDNVYLDYVSDKQKSLIHLSPELSESALVKAGKNCSGFVQSRGYLTEPTSSEERDFPIAFSLIVYRDPGRVERLLRTIYQPQNVYCIHVDKGASSILIDALETLQKCLKGVFMASRRVNVIWGHYSVLEAELICMEDLLKRNTKWRYFINLTGQEFPLKTNYELVKILKTYGGANDIAGYSPGESRAFHHRILYVRRLSQHNQLIKTKFRKDTLPYNSSYIKGRVHITVSREFVEFAMTDEKARVLASWLKDTMIPDETFFPLLQYNHHLGAPGSQIKREFKPYESVNRYKIFGPREFCHGKLSRGICIFGLNDLPRLHHAATNGLYLFANKFHVDYEPLAYDCLERLIRNRTKQIATSFDVGRYEKLFFVENYRQEKNKLI